MLKSVCALGAAAVLALSPSLVSASDVPRVVPGQIVVGVVHPEELRCGLDHMTVVQAAASSVPFQVPGAGVLTSWSTYANAGPGKARMLAFVPGQVGGLFNLVGKSALTDVTTNSVNTFGTRVPVPAGATLGLFVTAKDMSCGYDGPEVASGDVLAYSVLFQPDQNSVLQAETETVTAQVSVSAVWEPDVDADGHGDVTQDACPRSARSQVTCPPAETKVKRKPKKVSTDRTIRMRLKSADGATFTCAVDGGRAKPCASPYKKTFKYGKHVIVVTAVSAAGIPDPTPVKVTFRVVRP
jgi:hypothetical protein